MPVYAVVPTTTMCSPMLFALPGSSSSPVLHDRGLVRPRRPAQSGLGRYRRRWRVITACLGADGGQPFPRVQGEVALLALDLRDLGMSWTWIFRARAAAGLPAAAELNNQALELLSAFAGIEGWRIRACSTSVAGWPLQCLLLVFEDGVREVVGLSRRDDGKYPVPPRAPTALISSAGPEPTMAMRYLSDISRSRCPLRHFASIA